MGDDTNLPPRQAREVSGLWLRGPRESRTPPPTRWSRNGGQDSASHLTPPAPSRRTGDVHAERPGHSAPGNEKNEVIDMPFGVPSEVGKLRKVMVHRPGLEHFRLTPSNAEELLFDDVLWVERAQEEHDKFCQAMRERGVEVFEVGRASCRERV